MWKACERCEKRDWFCQKHGRSGQIVQFMQSNVIWKTIWWTHVRKGPKGCFSVEGPGKKYLGLLVDGFGKRFLHTMIKVVEFYWFRNVNCKVPNVYMQGAIVEIDWMCIWWRAWKGWHRLRRFNDVHTDEWNGSIVLYFPECNASKL